MPLEERYVSYAAANREAATTIYFDSVIAHFSKTVNAWVWFLGAVVIGLLHEVSR